ncbi:MAG TPA: hypothetical protein VMD09_14895 [Solirubrobacteraceae bacterium]|nr:hypothetical protein [Solirubrobacteraceae bacterium]
MTASRSRSGIEAAPAAHVKSRRWRAGLPALGLALAAAILLAGAPVALAHGPIDPIASSYLARVGSAPPGLEAKVVDGDLRMWLKVRRGLTVTVVDSVSRGPYLRFSPAGVFVNENSAMYYLNQTPVALTPPASLRPTTPPSWHQVSTGTSYEWHDGRLHALASVALTPGSSFVGHWQIPLLVNGTRSAITGGLWHAANPSIVWFWPLVVLLACVLAGWRLHRPNFDGELSRGLGLTAVVAVSVAVLGRDLHGRPGVSVFELVELAAVLAFAVWALHRLLFVRHGYFTYFLIAIVALWQGAELIPTLLQGFVLAAEPAFLARTAAVVCLGTGAALLLMVFRLADLRDPPPPAPDETAEVETEDDSAWELA